MSQSERPRRASIRHVVSVLPLFVLAPLAMAPRGCSYGMIGGDCPLGADCGDNGSTGTAGGASTDKSCGGLTGAGCDNGKFCDFPPASACGAADQTGVCTIIPQVCPDIVDPVCGCDGRTYNNECAAERASVSVASKGACSTSGAGAACGGLLGKACLNGDYCEFPIVTKCGSGDQTGTCAAVPEVCPDLFAPVCGCDGKTYSNACNAAQAAMSVKSAGRCSG